MKKIILSWIFSLLCIGSALPQSADQVLKFDRLPFYGNSFVIKDHHVSVRKVRREMMQNMPEAIGHFKNINRIRVAQYPSALITGLFTGLGLSWLMYSNNADAKVIGSSLLVLGCGSMITLYELDRLEKSEMIQIAEIYNKQYMK